MSAHRILGLEQVPKGTAVRRLKAVRELEFRTSWDSSVPYPPWAQESMEAAPVRRGPGWTHLGEPVVDQRHGRVAACGADNR